MPCLLRTMELEEIEYYQVTVSGVPLLAIHFLMQICNTWYFLFLGSFPLVTIILELVSLSR